MKTSTYVIFKSVVRDHIPSVKLPNRPDVNLESIIEDIIMDVNFGSGKVVTERIYENTEKYFGINEKEAKKIVDKFAQQVKVNNISEDFDDSDISTEFNHSNIFTEFNELEILENMEQLESLYEKRTGVTKLKGRDKEKAKSKGNVMSELQKDPKFQSMKKKFFAALERMAKKIAKEKGISPQKINLDKISLKR